MTSARAALSSAAVVPFDKAFMSVCKSNTIPINSSFLRRFNALNAADFFRLEDEDAAGLW